MSPDRATAIDAFYREHHRRLERKLAGRIGGVSDDPIEEACQQAWTALLRRPDVRLDRDGMGWLTMVATQEAWRAARPKDVPTGAYALSADRGVIAEPGAHPGPALDEQIVGRELHRQRVQHLARLKPAERQALGLHAVGCSYSEIGRLTGASYTAVNRRLAEGRVGLRRLEATARPSDSAE